MWNLDLKKLEAIAGPLGRIAVETGTCRGNGTRALARHFSRVITIELSEPLARVARERLAGSEFGHVEFVLGDSALELPRILAALPPEENVFFFLDAHWSGDRKVRWPESGWQGYGIDTAHRGQEGRAPSGEEQCPLAEELAAIRKACPGRALLLLDDMKNIPAAGAGLRNGTFPGEDWSHLSREKLLSLVEGRLVAFHELENPRQWLLELKPLA